MEGLLSTGPTLSSFSVKLMPSWIFTLSISLSEDIQIEVNIFGGIMLVLTPILGKKVRFAAKSFGNISDVFPIFRGM